jgi:hypothetical protein
MNQCRVLIISAHSLFAEGVRRLLNGRAGVQVVGVLSPDEAVVSLLSFSPDVVIVDAGNGAQAAFARMLRENPGIKFISLTLDNNDINIYYQRLKQSTGVEALMEAIQEPLEWKPPERPALRLLVITQSAYGERIADYVRRRAPRHWLVQQWAVPPLDGQEPGDLLPPVLPAAELILSLGETPYIARLLPEIAQMTQARSVIAPIDDGRWLPADVAAQVRRGLSQLGVSCVFPKPFCSLSETRYNIREGEADLADGPIREFARSFGHPALKISLDAEARMIQAIDVLRDGPCGCGQYLADQLVGVPITEAEQRTRTLHQSFPCLASTQLDRDTGEVLFQVAGQILRDAVVTQLQMLNARPGLFQSAGPFE